MIRIQSLAVTMKRFLGLFFKLPHRASLLKVRGKGGARRAFCFQLLPQ